MIGMLISQVYKWLTDACVECIIGSRTIGDF